MRRSHFLTVKGTRSCMHTSLHMLTTHQTYAYVSTYILEIKTTRYQCIFPFNPPVSMIMEWVVHFHFPSFSFGGPSNSSSTESPSWISLPYHKLLQSQIPPQRHPRWSSRIPSKSFTPRCFMSESWFWWGWTSIPSVPPEYFKPSFKSTMSGWWCRLKDHWGSLFSTSG